MTGVVDAGLGQRLLDGPLRATPDSLPPESLSTESIPTGERRVGFSPSGALMTYFHGTSGQFSGSLFDSIGGGGDRLDIENQITREDVLALAAVNAPVPAAIASLMLAQPASGRLATWLRQLPTDIDLWDAEDHTLAIATEACDEIRTIHEAGTRSTADGGFAATKLLARKRPRLVPLYDEKVRGVVHLAEGASWWFSLRDAMRADGEDNEVRFRVCAAMREADVGYVSVLRGLDVILWSYATSATARRSRPTEGNGDVMVLGEMRRLHGRAGAHEAFQTGTGLAHRGLDPAIVSGLSALVEDGPDKVGDEIRGDPPLQLG